MVAGEGRGDPPARDPAGIRSGLEESPITMSDGRGARVGSAQVVPRHGGPSPLGGGRLADVGDRYVP